MSEYQYYEFQAIDRSLTAEEMGVLRSYSTRARITPTSSVCRPACLPRRSSMRTAAGARTEAPLYRETQKSRHVTAGKSKGMAPQVPLDEDRTVCTRGAGLPIDASRRPRVARSAAGHHMYPACPRDTSEDSQ